MKYKLFVLDIAGIVMLLFGVAAGAAWFFAALFLALLLLWLWVES